MDFPDDFNQLELLNTHGHVIPRGAGLWSGSKDEEEEFDEEESLRSEECYLEKEKTLKDNPKGLILWAAETNRVSTINRLLAASPGLVDACDEDGYTPLHRAAYGGHMEAVSALLAAGAKVNRQTMDGWTPLHSACRWSRVAVASLLLKHGAELNGQTKGGLTPLHLAASQSSSFKADTALTLELLLSQRQLKLGLRSSGGETASEVARGSGLNYFLFEMAEECVSVAPMQ